MKGTSRIASAPGKMIGAKRPSPGNCGVRPPCPNQACPRTTVKPAAMKFSATPDTIWLPRLVMTAKPWIKENKIETAMPASRPAQGFAVM
ncbi:hypothetical protein D3C80_1219150 [compost metagenome]